MSFNEYDRSTKPSVSHDDLEQAKFLKTLLNEIAVRVGNSQAAPLYTLTTDEKITLNTLFTLTNSSGLLVGEVYDKITYGLGTEPGEEAFKILTYTLEDVLQFEIIIDLTDQENFSILKRSPPPPAPVLGYTANLGAWYKWDAGVLNDSDLPCVLNDEVKTWQDQTVNAYHLTQTTATQKPLFKDDHLWFDGINDLLLRTTGALQTSGGAIFILWSGDASASGIADLFAGGDADGQLFRENTEFLAGVSVNMRMYGGAFANQLTYTYGEMNVTCLIFNGASSFHRKNGTSIGPANAGTTVANGLAVGAARTTSRPFKGKIKEILYYTVAPTGSNIATVEDYLTARGAL